MDSLFEEPKGFTSLFLWNLLPPILTPIVAKIYGFVGRRLFSNFVTDGNINRHRTICRVLTLSVILLGVVINAIIKHESSLFLEMGLQSGCKDPKIKSEYRKFLKESHPDKIGATSDDFMRKKLKFDAIKNEERCIMYDTFGTFKVGDKLVDRTDKETIEHCLMEAFMFYAMTFMVFFGLSLNKKYEQSVEALVVFSLALVLDLDGIVFYRNRVTGKLLKFLSWFIGQVSISDFRLFVRSILFSLLIYIRQVKQLFSPPALTQDDKRTLLKTFNQKCDIIISNLGH